MEEGRFINSDTKEKSKPIKIPGNIVFIDGEGIETTLWNLEHTYYTEKMMTKED